MKKTLCLLLIAAAMFTVKTMAAVKTVPHLSADTVRAKFKRPAFAMAEADAKAILTQMRQKRSDAEKIAVVKSALKQNGITVDQLTTLMNQFLEDKSKLEVAEYAYPNVVNYKTFLDLQNLFAEEQNKNALEDFVRKYK